MKKFCLFISMLCLIFVLSGCYKLNERLVLNPDGSGKAIIDATITPSMSLNFTGKNTGGGADPATTIKETVRSILQKSSGVDVWDNVSYNWTDEGKIRFSGTAYFKDVNVFSVYNLDTASPTFTTEQGKLVFQMGKPPKDVKGKEGITAPPLSEKEMANAILNKKSEYQQMKPFLAAVLTDLKIDKTIVLPGTVERTTNLQKTGGNEVRFVLDGSKMSAALEELTKSEEFWRKIVTSDSGESQSFAMDDAELNEKLFGEKGPVSAVVSGPVKPQFDYASESAAARKSYENVLRQLGDSVSAAADVPVLQPGAEFKSTEITAVKYNTGSPEEEYVLTVTATLPGKTLKTTGGRLEKAIALNGKDLLPDSDFSREINFPQLNEERTAITFDVSLKFPGDDSKGIKEVSGVVEYLAGDESKTEKTDIGITAFSQGSKGKNFGAVIDSIDGKTFSLTLAVPTETLKDIAFYDASGKELQKNSSGWSSFGDDQTTFTFEFDESLPAQGKIVVESYTALQKRKTAFSFKNISLFGKPLSKKSL